MARGRVGSDVSSSDLPGQLGFDFDAPVEGGFDGYGNGNGRRSIEEVVRTPVVVADAPSLDTLLGGVGVRVPSPSATPAPEVPRARGRAAVRAQTAVMFSRLQQLGLRGINALVLMRTRTVMVSLIGQTLRVHEGYADAPEPVLRAIVTFATARNRAIRSAARDEILAYDVERAPATRRAEPARPGDIALISSLVIAHREFNDRHFSGALNEIPIRLSGRMATRLGHFDPGSRLTPPEIVMSRRHVVRHGWKEAMHTLLHEMVHQWQHETGQPVDHLAGFRRKCREVGITPAARRDVTPLKPRRQKGVA